MISREPIQLVGFEVSMKKSAKVIQNIVDNAPEADFYCSDGYVGYLDITRVNIFAIFMTKVIHSLWKVSMLTFDTIFRYLRDATVVFHVRSKL